MGFPALSLACSAVDDGAVGCTVSTLQTRFALALLARWLVEWWITGAQLLRSSALLKSEQTMARADGDQRHFVEMQAELPFPFSRFEKA